MINLIFLVININLIINSKNWLIMWIFLELTTFMIIIKMMKMISSMIKMFIFQMILSINMIMAITIFNSFINMNWWMMNSMQIILMTKMMIHPISNFVINIQKNMPWNTFIYMNFILKIPIMFMIKNIIINNMLIIMMINSMILKTMSSIKIMMFNISINNIFWIIMMMNMNMKDWNIVFWSYLVMNIVTINMFEKLKMCYISNTSICNQNTKTSILMMMMNLISIPLMIMFNFKWILVKTISNSFVFASFSIVNMINQFMYLKMIMMILVNNLNTKKWMIEINKPKYFILSNIMITYIITEMTM